MKLQSLEIVGLHGSNQTIKLDFNDDLNIITGKNGAGKTTILKIIWCILGCKYHKITTEIDFKSISLTTSKCKRTLTQLDDSQDGYEVSNNGEGGVTLSANSLFFPTYRRFESDFGNDNKILSSYFIKQDQEQDKIDNNHKLIMSIGTQDIQDLLIKKYSEISEEINEINRNVYSAQMSLIKDLETNNNPTDKLAELKKQIEDTNGLQAKKMQPFELLKDTVAKFLSHSSLTLAKLDKNTTLKIGDAVDALNANVLSAGEKQILSFIAYNTFYENTIFIIDEPELSLHGDWQRQLIPTLLKQGTNNQFIVATHSPFIYSKYPDKEIRLMADRGHNDLAVSK